ncbi:MAG: hypothetical protein LBM08_00920 [Dysgonamonadaceae bacterium]|jgi:hypothetical protein|nr:hypothetical protein [Dysgonamonadaceae bacterium]
MEENIQLEDAPNEIGQKLQKEIEKTVAELKEKDPLLKRVFPIVVFGNDEDGKDKYIGYFRQPGFTVFSKYLSATQANQAVAMRTLAKDCFVDGDKELVDDDSLFLFGLMGQLGKIIEIRQGKLVNLSKPGK